MTAPRSVDFSHVGLLYRLCIIHHRCNKRFLRFFILVTFFTFLTFFIFFPRFFYFQVTLSKKHAADGYLNFTGWPRHTHSCSICLPSDVARGRNSAYNNCQKLLIITAIFSWVLLVRVVLYLHLGIGRGVDHNEHQRFLFNVYKRFFYFCRVFYVF